MVARRALTVEESEMRGQSDPLSNSQDKEFSLSMVSRGQFAVEDYIDRHDEESDEEGSELLICQHCNNAYDPDDRDSPWEVTRGGLDIGLTHLSTGRRYCSSECVMAYVNGKNPLPPPPAVVKYREKKTRENRHALLLLQAYQRNREFEDMARAREEMKLHIKHGARLRESK